MGKILNEIRRIYNREDLDSVILFVTAACNFKCGFCCYADNLNQGGDMKMEALEKIARSTGRFRSLRISGGEPFLKKTLGDILRLFRRECGVAAINIPTNGWYGDRTVETVSGFLSEETEATLTIVFSIDGVGEVNDTVRGMPGGYERSLETLRRLGELKDRFPNLRLEVTSVLTGPNAESIDSLIDVISAGYPEVDQHNVGMVRDIDLERADYASKEALVAPLLRLARKSMERNAERSGRTKRGSQVPPVLSRIVAPELQRSALRVTVDRVRGKLWPFPCVAGRTTIVIDSRGRLSPCELRSEKVELAEHDWDVRRAMASGAYQAALERLAEDRCDCIHGCFIGDSLVHSGGYFLRSIPIRGLMHKALIG